MSVLDLFAEPARKWIKTSEEQRLAEYAIECMLFYDHDARDDPHTDPGLPVLPGRECDRITYDLVDWDGISLEFKGYSGALPNDDELTKLFALGFTVIDIEHTPDDEKTVVWRRVKGKKGGMLP